MSGPAPAGAGEPPWAAALDDRLVRRLLGRRARLSRPARRAVDRLALPERRVALALRLAARARLLEEEDAPPPLPLVQPVSLPPPADGGPIPVAPSAASPPRRVPAAPVARGVGPSRPADRSAGRSEAGGAGRSPELPAAGTAVRGTRRAAPEPGTVAGAPASAAPPRSPAPGRPTPPAVAPGPRAEKRAAPGEAWGARSVVVRPRTTAAAVRRPVVRPRPAAARGPFPVPGPPAAGGQRRPSAAAGDHGVPWAAAPSGPPGWLAADHATPVPAGPHRAEVSPPAPAPAPAPALTGGVTQPLRSGGAPRLEDPTAGGVSPDELVDEVLRRLDRELTVAAERRGRGGGEWRGGHG